jgi:hypothetical protein
MNRYLHAEHESGALDWLSGPCWERPRNDAAAGNAIIMGCCILPNRTIQPVTAVQTVMPADQVAQATALMMFANYFGGSLFVSFGKTVFSNRLVPALQEFSPLLNAQDIINAGATGVRLVVSEEDLPGVLLAFNQALTETFVSDFK